MVVSGIEAVVHAAERVGDAGTVALYLCRVLAVKCPGADTKADDKARGGLEQQVAAREPVGTEGPAVADGDIRQALGTSGDIDTITGSASGTAGSSGDSGPASSALLHGPESLSVDSSGDLYIADQCNHRVQELAASTGTQWGAAMTAGDVYTVAGSASGASGASGDGGAASAALMYLPHAVSIATAGELYIADTGNNILRGVPSPATYRYQQTDQLAGVGTEGYSYGGDGLVTARTTPSGTATLTWDQTSGLSLLLSDGTNEYLYGPNGTPLEQADIANGTTSYFVSDDQGSTRALLGSAGTVVATFSYDPYGNLTSTTGTVTTPLLYDGQYYDSAAAFTTGGPAGTTR